MLGRKQKLDRRGIWTAVVVLVVTFSGAAMAQTNDSEDLRVLLLELRSELKQTRQDLAEAQKQIQLLNQEITTVMQQKHAVEESSSAEAYVSPADVNPQTAPEQSTHSGMTGDDLGLLRAKVEEQEQTKVESGSKYRVKLSGLILLNAFSTRGAVDVPDLPNRAFPSYETGNFGATMRQSIVGLQVIGPTIANGRTSAKVNADFFGGFPQMSFGTTNGIVRLREAYGRIDWDNDSITFGQQGPVISPLSPTSLATLAEPALSWSGNLWVWTPQIAYEHRLKTSDSSYFSLTGALMDPLTEEIPRSSQFYTSGPGQRSQRPAVAATVGWHSKMAGQEAQVGIGGYTSHLDYGAGREFESWAATAYWNLPFTRQFEFSGEAYRGRGVGGLGGAIWQSVIYDGTPDLPTTTVRPLNGVGGWAQLKFRATTKLELNSALGDDNVLSYDLRFAPQIVGDYTVPTARNRVVFGNAIYHLKSNVVLSLEYRKLWTYRYTGARATADQVNIGAGVSF